MSLESIDPILGIIAAVVTILAAIFGQTMTLRREITKSETKLYTRIDSVEANFNAKIDKLDVKIDNVEANLGARIDSVETKLDSKINKLDAKVDTLEVNLRGEIQALEASIHADFNELNNRIDTSNSRIDALFSLVVRPFPHGTALH